MIFKDGTVYDATLTNESLLIQNEMLNLVDDQTYFGLEYGNSLFFIPSTTKRQITHFNPFDYSFKGLQAYIKPIENKFYFYNQGIQVGDRFWAINRKFKSLHGVVNFGNAPFLSHDPTFDIATKVRKNSE